MSLKQGVYSINAHIATILKASTSHNKVTQMAQIFIPLLQVQCVLQVYDKY